MLVPENEIRVYYKREEKILEAWDLAIEDALVKIGMKMWGSGFDLTTGIRDLAFKPQTEVQG